MARVSDLDASVVALFPGQGSISPGAGIPWRDTREWSLIDEISSMSGVDVAHLLLDAPSDDLIRTDNAQLATFSLSLVGWRSYIRTHGQPRFLAGHSLGEISSLVAGGVLSLDDGTRIVGARGRAMARASADHPGSMVALMGPSDDALARLQSLPDVWVANINGPGQVVVSGTVAALDDLVARARELGWRRATALPVGGAFHSPLMADAQSALDDVLSTVTFSDTSSFVASNVNGEWHHGGEEWRTRLSTQLTSPVQFQMMIESLDSSVARTVEMPPAGVLVGLVKRIRDMSALDPYNAPAGVV